MQKREFFFLYLVPCFFIIVGIYTLFFKPSLYGSYKSSLESYNSILDSTDDRGVVNSQPAIEAYFSPDQDIQLFLSKLIKEEKTAIWCAAFRFTDKILAQDIIDASKRGIKIIFLIDREGFSAIQSKLLHLFKEGIPMYVFPSVSSEELKNIQNGIEKKEQNGKFSTNALMHNKFIIFHSQKIVCTGSYNYTKSAAKQNQENVVMIKNIPSILDSFKKQFEMICSRSTLFLSK
jgi:phosphatidylserine/phosphatidylglycerophosphate/cardiolipin synthase-like enzyme